MKVNEVMTREVRLVRPDQTLRSAARLMAEMDIGSLPVQENDRLVGMITDRDLAVRGMAEGLGPDAQVSEVMTLDVKYCFDDQSVGEVARNMADIRVRRLPVVNRDKRLVGILSLGDVACQDSTVDEAGIALSGVSKPGGAHSQATGRH